MAEYIDKKEAAKVLTQIAVTTAAAKMRMVAKCINAVELIPAADVAPVVHGWWKYEPPTINTYAMLKCSKCGWWTLDESVCNAYRYCPNCGAKMDLEE